MTDYLLKDLTHNPLRAEVFADIDRERREQIVSSSLDLSDPGIANHFKLVQLLSDLGDVARADRCEEPQERARDLREELVRLASDCTAWCEAIAEEWSV